MAMLLGQVNEVDKVLILLAMHYIYLYGKSKPAAAFRPPRVP